jgi:isoleucyl-tRNA synthetase
VPQSPTIETVLSSHELAQNYKDVHDPNCYLKLKIISSPIKSIENAQVMVWTTTPWTLFANVALAVGEDINYVHIKNNRKLKDEVSIEELVLAESRLSVLDGEIEIISSFKGKELVGTVYEQIFDYCKIDRIAQPNALTILPGDFVSTEDGSGIVHLAPAFGEDDYRMSQIHNLPFLQPVTRNGHFTEELGVFAHKAIKTFVYKEKVDNGEDKERVETGADKEIVKALKEAGKIYRATYDYVHSYPFCWRTDNPIMYYARESWFIKSPEYKDKMIELNKQIRWQPSEIGEGRFGNWLEEVKEWSLSRDRFWGTPLPIWVSEDGSDMFAIGSLRELCEGLYEFDDGKRVAVNECGLELDIHRPFVDHVIFEKNGKIYRRIKEVIDVWFDSGAMPFAQMHYPFENQDLFEKMFPGDFIAEGIDQTRGWFYTLHNIATALFGKPAFKNIVVNELILDKNGEKMSKSKGNVVDPFLIMEKYSADAVRWYLYSNNPPWKATLFNVEDIARTVISDFFRTLTNTYAFFALYANIDNFTGLEDEIQISQRPEIDRWIISRVNSLLSDYRSYMEDYELTKAHRAVQSFAIYELSNWYVRRNRRRFWKGENDSDKLAAYQTLRYVIMNLLTMIAPTAPFLAEYLYQRIKTEKEPLSIHLFLLPESDLSKIDPELEERMEIAQRIVNLSRSLREKSRIKVRQPLRRILIPVDSPEQRREIQSVEDIIKEEINVKAIDFVTDETEDIVKRRAKPNFKTIGKKFGDITKFVAASIKALNEAQIKLLEETSLLNIQFDLSISDVNIFEQPVQLKLKEENLKSEKDSESMLISIIIEALNKDQVKKLWDESKLLIQFEIDEEVVKVDVEKKGLKPKSKEIGKRFKKSELVQIVESVINSIDEKLFDRYIQDGSLVFNYEILKEDVEPVKIEKQAKPNFNEVNKTKEFSHIISSVIEILEDKQIRKLEEGSVEKINFTLDREDVEISGEEIEGWLVSSDEGITVALDTQLDEELLSEGIAREFVNRVQDIRKKSGLEVTDRIILEFESNEKIKFAIDKTTDYIKNETLADSVNFVEKLDEAEIDLDGVQIKIKVIKNR